jgi:hypothetical protein
MFLNSSYHCTCRYGVVLFPLVPLLYENHRIQVCHSTFPQMPRDQAHWEPSQIVLLLKLAIAEKQKGNWNQYGVTKEGWRNIYPHFPQYTHKQVTNKFDSLKRKYRDWQDAQSGSGLGRDPATGGIAAEPDYWETQFGSNHPDDSTQSVVSLLRLPLSYLLLH